MNKTNVILSAITLAALVGCGGLAQKKDISMGVESIPSDKRSSISLRNSETFPGEVFATRFSISISEIDGVKVDSSTVDKVYLAPGKHEISWDCWGRVSPRDTGSLEGKGTTEVNLQPGQHYFGKAKVVQFATKYSQTGYHESTGTCNYDGLYYYRDKK